MDSIDKINQILLSKGMTGAELEKAIGVSHSVYSQWNTRRTKPSTKSLKKVADVLGVSIERILPDDEEVSAAFYAEGLTQEEEDELWNRAREFYNFIRQQKLKEKQKKK